MLGLYDACGAMSGRAVHKSCLPGPGAKSGWDFVNGKKLGISASNTLRGFLHDEWNKNEVKVFPVLEKHWKNLRKEYKGYEKMAVLKEEKEFWLAMAVHLEYEWYHPVSGNPLRTQFRLCEFGKIGNIVCRSQGTLWSPTAALDAAAAAAATADLPLAPDEDQEKVEEVDGPLALAPEVQLDNWIIAEDLLEAAEAWPNKRRKMT